jgi:hypothetical protein
MIGKAGADEADPRTAASSTPPSMMKR